MNGNLAYSMHLGSDKNKTSKAKQIAKNNTTGTTSFSNNSIQSSGQLTKVDKHNIGKYETARDDISVIYGTTSIVNDVNALYLQEFEQARIDYNNKQTREDRKIYNYFDNVSKNANRDLACELIIELGDMEFWKDKTKEYKYKMVQVYKEQIKDLEAIIPEFKIANAVIHFDESSPHLHIVGVPVKDGYKNGMKKQVAKSLIFTKERLVELQDKMRNCCIQSFNQCYNLDYKLKTKEKGRNIDIPVSKMQGYRELKKQQEQNKERLAQANQKTDLLTEKINNVEEIIKDLKPTKLSKNNYVISASSIDTLNKYISNVKDTTTSIKSVNDLDVIIKEYRRDLQEHKNEVRTLNRTISLKDNQIKELTEDLDIAKNTISKQNTKITFLQEQVNKFKGLWKKLWRFFEEKVRFNGDKTYADITEELYNNGVFGDEEVQRIKTGHVENANKKKKNYDRF